MPGLTDEFMHHTAPSDAARPAGRADEIFAELFDQRRREPRDDLLTALLAAEIDGERLGEDELLGFGWLLLVGGNDTTTNLIGNGLELFARHPDQRCRLAEDPARLGAAVEEVLRYASPTHSLPRTATRDVEMHGEVIRAGSRVLLLWQAANLDEREFSDPEHFDVDRHVRATSHSDTDRTSASAPRSPASRLARVGRVPGPHARLRTHRCTAALRVQHVLRMGIASRLACLIRPDGLSRARPPRPETSP